MCLIKTQGFSIRLCVIQELIITFLLEWIYENNNKCFFFVNLSPHVYNTYKNRFKWLLLQNHEICYSRKNKNRFLFIYLDK